MSTTAAPPRRIRPPRNRLTVRHDIDLDGTPIVVVSFGKHEATLYADDFRQLETVGLARWWKANSDGKGRWYVRTHTEGIDDNITISRAILGVSKRVVVRYADGNPFNLRRSNLIAVNRETHVSRFRKPTGSGNDEF